MITKTFMASTLLLARSLVTAAALPAPVRDATLAQMTGDDASGPVLVSILADPTKHGEGWNAEITVESVDMVADPNYVAPAT